MIYKQRDGSAYQLFFLAKDGASDVFLTIIYFYF